MYSEGVLFLVFIKEMGYLQAIRFPKVNRAVYPYFYFSRIILMSTHICSSKGMERRLFCAVNLLGKQ